MGLSDKNKFLSGLEIEEKNTFTKLYDRAQRAAKFGGAMFGDFLSMGEISHLTQREKYLPEAELCLYGGYEDAERKMAGFNAEWDEFPIAAIKISGKNLDKLTHRDYLGSLMGLGLEREKLGDIIISDGGAAVIAHADVADYIAASLLSVGKFPVSAETAALYELELPERRFEEKGGTVASLRLDSVCALMLGKGRGSAGDFIRAGRVFVNGIAAEKMDHKLNDGDTITVRGFGKAELEIGGKSKKDRIFVTLKKYV